MFFENQHLSKIHEDLSSALARAYSTKLKTVVKGKQMDGDGDNRDVKIARLTKISKPEKSLMTTRGRRGLATFSAGHPDTSQPDEDAYVESVITKRRETKRREGKLNIGEASNSHGDENKKVSSQHSCYNI